MKTILCIAPYTFLPAQSGGQKAILSLYKTLSKNFRIICVSTKNNRREEVQEFEVKNILSDSPLRYINFFYFFSLKSIIRKEKPDYLQIEHPYFGWLAVLLKRSTGIRLIVRSHNIEGIRFRDLKKWWWKGLLLYEKWVLKQADFVFFITDEDRFYAIKNFGISLKNTHTITFGTDITHPPSPGKREAAKTIVLKEQKLSRKDIIVLFNGAFGYSPNTKALHDLILNIFPLIQKTGEKDFKLIICGKDIPDNLIQTNTNPDIIFAGFVEDIKVYLQASCVFVNPITEGGGIKTKLAEALAFNVNCISYTSGAIGIPSEICGEKLIIVSDNDHKSFARAIISAAQITSDIPASFYNRFSNATILETITNLLQLF